MARREYVVTDPSDPEEFKTRIYQSLLDRKNIIVTARPILDELARQRDETAEEIQFEFHPSYLGLDPSDYSLDVQDVRSDAWVHITVQQDIRFHTHRE